MPSIWSSTLNLRFERFQMSLSSDRVVPQICLRLRSGSYLPGLHRWADQARKELEMRAKRVKMGKNGYRL